MVYLFYDEDGVKNNKAFIRRIVYDGSILTDEERNKAIAVDNIPENPYTYGYLYIDLESKSLFWEQYKYKEAEATELEQRIADLEAAVAAILGGAL